MYKTIGEVRWLELPLLRREFGSLVHAGALRQSWVSASLRTLDRMDDQVHWVRITAEHTTGTVVLDGRDISSQVFGYELRQSAGQPAELLLFLSPLVKNEFDGLARVAVGVSPDPGPAAAAFLSAIDAGRAGAQRPGPVRPAGRRAARDDRAMLALLQDWASGRWQPEVAAADGRPYRSAGCWPGPRHQRRLTSCVPRSGDPDSGQLPAD